MTTVVGSAPIEVIAEISAKEAGTSRRSGLLSGLALAAQMSRKTCAMSEPSSGTAQLVAGQVVGLASSSSRPLTSAGYAEANATASAPP